MRTLAVCALLAAPTIARANPYSVVPSGGEAGTAAAVSIDYTYEVDTSVITRERVGTVVGGTPVGAIPKTKDLLFHQYKHTVTPRLDVGVFPDTWVTIALPIIIQQARELRLADGVARADSSTLQDGYVPTDGYDANDPTTAPGGDMVFRGHDRHGLSQIHLGIATAPMNQRRDPTKPTWRIGSEVRLALGKQMDFSQGLPDRTGVSTGVDEIRVWTSLDKKLGRFEPWFELFWQAPIATRSSSVIQNPGFGSTNTTLGQTGGASFGVEGYAIDDPINGNKISVDFGARTVAHFEGRDYSEMWEVFAYAGDAHVATNPLILDADPTRTGVQPFSHPGVTNIENYLETATRIAVRAQLGPHVNVAALVDLAWKSAHDISFADAGTDLPTCPAGVTAHCEVDDNIVINPGTVEVNPLHQAKIDLAGHRYHAEGSFALTIGVMGQFIF